MILHFVRGLVVEGSLGKRKVMDIEIVFKNVRRFEARNGTPDDDVTRNFIVETPEHAVDIGHRGAKWSALNSFTSVLRIEQVMVGGLLLWAGVGEIWVQPEQVGQRWQKARPGFAHNGPLLLNDRGALPMMGTTAVSDGVAVSPTPDYWIRDSEPVFDARDHTLGFCYQPTVAGWRWRIGRNAYHGDFRARPVLRRWLISVSEPPAREQKKSREH